MSTEELSLKQIILIVREYASLLWMKKFFILGFALLIFLLFGTNAYLKPTTYATKQTFMLKEGGGSSGPSGILGQIGLGGLGGEYNFNKLTEIAMSNLVLESILFDSAAVNGHQDLIANHIIRIEEVHEDWDEDGPLGNFLFRNKTEPRFDKKENSADNNDTEIANLATKSLVSRLRGDPSDPRSDKLVELSVGEKSQILTLRSVTKNEELSCLLATIHYEKLSDFYRSSSTKSQEKTYKSLQQKADSIYSLMVSAEYSAAEYQDKSAGVFLNRNRLPLAQYMRKSELYAKLYGEVVKNQETASFMLMSQTPMFQVIDVPTKPLNKTPKRIVFNSILGLFLGGLLSCVFFILKEIIYKSLMNDE